MRASWYTYVVIGKLRNENRCGMVGRWRCERMNSVRIVPVYKSTDQADYDAVECTTVIGWEAAPGTEPEEPAGEMVGIRKDAKAYSMAPSTIFT